MPPKARPIVNTHQVYNSSNKPPPKKVAPTLIHQPQISIPNVTPVITPTAITPTAIIPKITLPTYSGPSGAHTSYPTIQKQPETLSTDNDNKEENILKKYPQLLLFIPLILIILSKNK